MRRILALSVAAVLGLTANGWAGGLLCSCKPHCSEIPPEDRPNCPCPCGHRLPMTLFGSGHAQKLADELCNGDCCDRIKAAKKLGHRLHADYCNDPCVLNALIGALQCDKCWEVRRAAAWALLGQRATSDEALLALYVSSKIDPHYLVRDRAAEALDILTLCHKACYKGLYESGDKLVKELKAAKWAPGGPNCRVEFAGACAGCGIPLAAPPAGELIPAPKKGAMLESNSNPAVEVVIEPAPATVVPRPLPVRP